MKIRMFQIDAFTDRQFHGNPAAVCPLERWLADAVMQDIAAENNLAETAFYLRTQEGFHIRWFTPEEEVDLCGHATLATAYAIFAIEGVPGNTIHFASRSGPLSVTKQGTRLTLDFPVDVLQEVVAPEDLVRGLNITPVAAYKGKTDYMLVLSSQRQILHLDPDYKVLSRVPCRGIIVTSPGEEADFVSRFFAPTCGVPEDPVTGSAHTTLTPYWAQRLGKQVLSAQQVSKRGGSLTCTLAGDRVLIAGEAVPYLTGEIEIPDEAV
jgi:PhzF family phenazine biosynthesis protein